MNKKIRVAFIYKNSVPFLSPKNYDPPYYHFFMDALKRNQRIQVTYFPGEEKFDVRILKGKYDIILLYENWNWGVPDELIGIDDVDIPIISRCGDFHAVKKYNIISYHDKYKIDYYFGFNTENLFHQFYPKKFNYKTIIFGLEPSLYQNMTPFNQRIKNKILNSGAVGNPKLISKIIGSILDPDSNAYKHYKLRAMCNNLSYVDYTPTLQNEYVGDKYPLLLSKYASAIAATTTFPTIKYWEIPAAGCLTFMEITELNEGKYLGYQDGETAIFINENNYKEKFNEYLNDPDNPKWEIIANQGRKYALENFSNDKAVDTLVDLMEEIIK
jgi:hypothetical protein